MSEIAWCSYCEHKSAFEIKGTCLQKLDPYDESVHFPILNLVGYYDSGYGDTGEFSIEMDRFDFQARVLASYTLEKQWVLMQCLVCSQPILIEYQKLYCSNNRYDSDFDNSNTSEFFISFDKGAKGREVKITPEEFILYTANKNVPNPTLHEKTPTPHENMPTVVTKIFNEARMVFNNSPRASAALLRLALQTLFKHFNLPGKSINETISNLVQSQQLSKKTIQACDSIRVIGNNNVHPGEINLTEDPKITLSLFHLLNYIIDDIEGFQKTQKIYDNLPEEAKKAIKNRDARAQNKQDKK